jgi:succinate dehydrogenase / fumarate reductase, cytochrome b subunit
MTSNPMSNRPRPFSPNIQIYRPQLTSVLSIVHRITGVLLSGCAVVLVVWLNAAATGPQAYAIVQGAIASWMGQMVLFGATFAFFCISAAVSAIWSGTPCTDSSSGQSTPRDGQ